MNTSTNPLDADCVAEFFECAHATLFAYPVGVDLYYADILSGGLSTTDAALIHAGLIYINPHTKRQLLYTQLGVDFYKLLCI